MFGREVREHPAAGGTSEETDLHEVGFIDVFNGVFFFGDSGGYGFKSNRPAVEILVYQSQYLAVGIVQPQLINTKKCQRLVREGTREGHLVARGLHLGVVAYTLKQSVGDPGGEARSGSNFAKS